ncbi:M23 family metallopeptidase, partial [Georgenia sp. 10Sc9-8]|nr:M23 family metallopeptidase [Georgenia halotolerans]
AEAAAQPTAPALAVEAADRSGSDRAASRATERQAVKESSDAVARPAPVVMPLEDGTYEPTSPYGERTDPFTGARALHAGTDMSAPRNTPIHAVAGGVVDYVGPGKDGRSGMLIVLKHKIDGETVYSWYNHMFEDGVHVEEGQKVRAGDVIGGVGANGKATGTHLHLEIHTDDELTTVDPLEWLAEHDAVDVTEL